MAVSPQVPKSRTATTSFVPGLDFAPGEHVCAFYRGVGGRDEVLVPYLTEGLRAGQKCLAVVDESGRDDLLATLAREPGSATAQLDVRTLAEAYLRNGTFAAEEMIHYWNTEIPASLKAGPYATARIAGEGSWAFADARTSQEIVRYEAALNLLANRHRQCVLCLYDLGGLTGGAIVDLMRTHPKLLLAGMVLENPHYVQPEEFLELR
jgi:hypothetical protein